MPLGPDPHAAESFSKAQPKLSQLVLHSGRDDGKNRAHHKTVRSSKLPLTCRYEAIKEGAEMQSRILHGA